MKRAFTLVEMLIVVAILATLMTIAFRLSSVGGDETYRTESIMRVQRLENCLSGYYAAFGSYPPVKLHGTRDIYAKVDAYGRQEDEQNESIWGWNDIGDSNEEEAWLQVRAACLSQPVSCAFPFSSDDRVQQKIQEYSDEISSRCSAGSEYKNWSNSRYASILSAGFGGLGVGNLGNVSGLGTETDWRNIQIFRFGLMSFLLPRYLIMMGGNSLFFTNCKQWDANNALPCDPFTGRQFGNWSSVHNYSINAAEFVKSGKSDEDLARLATIPTQAVCARWMPNLEGICTIGSGEDLKPFGVAIRWTGTGGFGLSDDEDSSPPNIEIFTTGEAGSGGSAYILNYVTVNDRWGNPIYYYSPPPYQTYTLWSGGKNGRTFPPWIAREKLETKARRCISLWVADDIVRMSH